MNRTPTIFTLSLAAVASIASPAMAHHVMGGGMPDTLMTGLLSGLGHPVIGVDHLAFIVAMGIAAAFTRRPLLSPLAFIAATVVGCLLLIGGIALPIVEIVVAASVLLLGAMVLSGRRLPTSAYLGVFAVAGLFHGWAYGESIVGAESTPLVAYFIGFAAIQYGIAVATGFLVRTLWQAGEPAALKPRLAGAIVAGIGATYLIENIESLLFV